MAMFFKSGRRFGKFKNQVRNFSDQQKKDLNESIRRAALEIINDLAEKGPEWDGTFKNSWVVSPLGGNGVSKGGRYPYKLSNIPKLSIKKEQFLRANKFEISNVATNSMGVRYAEYAMDLKPGRFTPPNFPRLEKGVDPKGNVVKTGKRDISRETFRGEISGGDGNSRITAPLDWYTTYMKGGGLQKSIGKGLKFKN